MPLIWLPSNYLEGFHLIISDLLGVLRETFSYWRTVASVIAVCLFIFSVANKRQENCQRCDIYIDVLNGKISSTRFAQNKQIQSAVALIEHPNRMAKILHQIWSIQLELQFFLPLTTKILALKPTFWPLNLDSDKKMTQKPIWTLKSENYDKFRP